jgi:signal transduction histidine kinase
LNLIIYFWGNQRREATVEALRQAVSRQALISALNQNLNDIQKQVTLLSELGADLAADHARPGDVAQFHGQLERIDHQIAELKDLSGPDDHASIDAFAAAYAELSASWRIYYDNLGIDQTKAITELAVRAEPLAQKVLKEDLPRLQNDEKVRVDRASVNFYQVARLTDRTTIIIFGISAAVALAVALLVSRQLTLGFVRLTQGTGSIGSGNLHERIDLKGNDELADLARAFNEMAGKLSLAHDQLTRVNEQEKKKSEELEKALDQLRKAQDQLVIQQKLASLGSLTAGIAHEIKNPLNFVTNFAEVSVGLTSELRQFLMEHRERIEPKAVENILDILADLEKTTSKIQEHGKRADAIVRNMLMHSRGQGERQITNINSLVSEYVKLAYHGMRAQNVDFNVTIQEELDPSIEPISVVAHDVSRVVLNIANNACYAAYEKKKRLGPAFSPVVKVSTKNHGSSVQIRIRDNGNGIPKQIRERVFEPFFTTKPTGSGTGLGLSISYDIIVQQHNGEIHVDSEPEQYTEFVITLPKVVS